MEEDDRRAAKDPGWLNPHCGDMGRERNVVSDIKILAEAQSDETMKFRVVKLIKCAWMTLHPLPKTLSEYRHCGYCFQ